MSSEVIAKETLEIPGLFVYQELLSEVRAAYILEEIDKLPWSNALSRRTQHYGYEYDYRSRSLPQKINPLPAFSSIIVDALMRSKIFLVIPDQLIINEYLPGQGISPHIDQPKIFGDTVVSISVIGDCIMEFQLNDQIIPIHFPARTAVVLKDDARYLWKHSIPARKYDPGSDIPRTRRVSLTFRNVVH